MCATDSASDGLAVLVTPQKPRSCSCMKRRPSGTQREPCEILTKLGPFHILGRVRKRYYEGVITTTLAFSMERCFPQAFGCGLLWLNQSPIRPRGRFTPGPYFVPFANLQDSVARNIPIYTTARACTILPNFVGCVLGRMAGGAR